MRVFLKVNKGRLIVRAKSSGGGYEDFAGFVEANMMEQKQKIDDMKKTNEWDQDALA